MSDAIFTACQHILRSESIRYDSPSDCLSVTVRYHVKTTLATIMRSSLEDSPMTSFLMVNFTSKFQREHCERRCRM